MKNRAISLSAALICACVAAGYPATASAQVAANTKPALIITSEPVPESLRNKVYARPAQVKEITAQEISGKAYASPDNTIVAGRVNQLQANLATVQGKVSNISDALLRIQTENDTRSAEYYAAVATVNTQLQSGTTPGNPRLVQRLGAAEGILDSMSDMVGRLNQLGTDAAQVASEASFLLEETRAAYSLSGAVEEDHVKLAETEDAVNNTVILVERVLNSISDDVTRSNAYLASERDNLRTLSLAVANGDLYGKSLSSRPFSNPASFAQASSSDMGAPQGQQAASPAGERPLVKIKFDRSDVDFEQPVYNAVNEALRRYPAARFNVVAVSPTKGNAAEIAIESTRARRNAEKVLRVLTQMGLPMDQVDLSYGEDVAASTNEVHIFVR